MISSESLTAKKNFNLGSDQLCVGQALEIARQPRLGRFSRETVKAIENSNRVISQIVNSEDVVYGINTGFGPLCTTIISKDKATELQYNILKSHSVGVGKPCAPEISRLMLLLKTHALSLGYSGVRYSTVERIYWHLQHDVIPQVPLQGSVGASGDLAPLAHLALPLIGLGKVYFQNKVWPSDEVLNMFGLKSLELGPKEGLALINGTQFMAAYAIQIVDRLYNCLAHADILGAMTLEALLGSSKPFHSSLHDLRPHSGCQHVALRLRKLLEGSGIMRSHLNCGRVQDPYSLRCMPQVHGAARSAWLHLKDITEIEINSVTDNPIVLHSGEAISGGNFHGQPLALPMDYAAIAASELGNISDRRIYLMLEGKVEGLPKLLMRDTGLNSGFMLPQYTSAALVSENKTLCFPASADSIPTSLGQEDHVSMGSISGRKALRIVDNLEKILAIELLCASQAFDFRRPLKSNPALEACHAYVRKSIDHAHQDRVFADDIGQALAIIQERKLVTISNEYLNQDHEIKGNDQYVRYELY
ncbi:MAG: histidine ammonia-lyase [Saprospiraceae bacterium]|nr:histidine ammonia-lyase [Saprospiraceae bacterium]